MVFPVHGKTAKSRALQCGLIFVALICAASASEHKDGTAKLKLIQSILATQSTHETPTTRTPEQIAFCTGFYGDLVKFKRIEFIEPVVVTNDQTDPRLAKYHYCTAEVQPNDHGTYWRIDSIGETNYQLYRADFDGQSENGLEEIVYAENEPGSYFLHRAGAYATVDLNACRFSWYAVEGSNQHTNDQGVTNGVNALISYKGSYYVMDLSNYMVRTKWKPSYTLTLDKLDVSRRSLRTCSFIHKAK